MSASPLHRIVRVEFVRFKAFKRFTLNLRHFNILVGPNNAGKSTVLAAFRILAAAIRKARRFKPKLVQGPREKVLGHSIDIREISVAEENIFHNYDDSEPAVVSFHLANRNVLTLFFPERGECFLLMDAQGHQVATTTAFRSRFNCQISFVPILGPVEHHEALVEEETTRRSLYSFGAARHFRNTWYHYPENFETFRELLKLTWPGMDILPPELDNSHGKPRLHMYCPEHRIPREVFWAGFGFQVWVQMLTHLVNANDASIFLIDEPDIYLHSDLQRQLLGLLRNLGPDILIATHSSEMITEAETDDIVLVAKTMPQARRIRNPSQVDELLRLLGSNINPILTQVAKTRRVLFVEGKDFQIVGRFARRSKHASVGNRAEFAVVAIDGFNPEKIRNLKMGMEKTLGGPIVAAAILDRDYRSDAECLSITNSCKKFCDYVEILQRKEIENFLLSPAAIDRAANRKVKDRSIRSGKAVSYQACAKDLLFAFCESKRTYVASQMLMARRQFERVNSPQLDESTVMQSSFEFFEAQWSNESTRLNAIPGKEALSAVNTALQQRYGVSVTATSIIDAMQIEEVPDEMQLLLMMLTKFVATLPIDTKP